MVDSVSPSNAVKVLEPRDLSFNCLPESFRFMVPAEFAHFACEELDVAVKEFSVFDGTESASVWRKGRALSLLKSVGGLDWLDFSMKAFNISRATAYSYLNYFMEFKDSPKDLVKYSKWLMEHRVKHRRLKSVTKVTKADVKFLSDKVKVLEDKLAAALDEKLKLKAALDANSGVLDVSKFVGALEESLNDGFKSVPEDDGVEFRKYVLLLSESVKGLIDLKGRVLKALGAVKVSKPALAEELLNVVYVLDNCLKGAVNYG